MTEQEIRLEWFRLYQKLPKWHRVVQQELRTRVLLQAIKDAEHVEFPSNIRSALAQVEFWIETHSGRYGEKPIK